MKELWYRILMALLTVVASLPLRALYFVADIIYAVIFHIVRYRRALVVKNVSESFPDKDRAEIYEIVRKFYRNFADYIVETIKLLHISDEEMSRRFRFDNLELLRKYTSAGRSVTVYYAHTFNWEWGTSVTLHFKKGKDAEVRFCQIYRPLKSGLFDRIMLKVRSRFGSLSLPKATAYRSLYSLGRQATVTVTGFMSDQKPSHGDPTVPVMFLGHPTAFISGTETLARRLNTPVIYFDAEKTGRGCYKVTCRPICAEPTEMAPGEITRKYATLLEKTIQKNPPIWLWSHNRWKIPVTLPLK